MLLFPQPYCCFLLALVFIYHVGDEHHIHPLYKELFRLFVTVWCVLSNQFTHIQELFTFVFPLFINVWLYIEPA